MLIASNAHQAKLSFSVAAFICLIIYCMSSLIGFVILSYEPKLNSNQVMFYAIDSFSIPFIRAFISIGIIAMVMSTIDSWLNTGAIIFTNDLCKPLGINKNPLIISRFFSIVIGTCSIFLAISIDNLMSIVLIGANFYMPIVTVPLMACLFGFKTREKVVIITMFLSAIVVLLWRFYIQPNTNIDSVIPGFFTSSITLFILHYFLGKNNGSSTPSDNTLNNGHSDNISYYNHLPIIKSDLINSYLYN